MTSRKEDKVNEGRNRDSREPDKMIPDPERGLDLVLAGLSKVLSMLFGDRIDLHFTSEEDRMKFLGAIREMADRSKEMERVKQSDIPAIEKLVKQTDLFDSAIRNIAPGLTEGKHIIDWAPAKLEEIIQGQTDDLFFVATRYREHVRTLESLLQECVSNGRYNDVEQFLERAEKEETFSAFQVYYARLAPAYEFLHEVFPITRMIPNLGINVEYQLIAKDSITRADVDRGLQYYRDFAGEFEKQVAVIVGLLKIATKGIKPDYDKIRRRDLALNLTKVERNEKYRGLVTPFSKTIRNALAHSRYVVDPIEEKITFSDRYSSLTLTYLKFLRKLADLSGLVLALWSPRMILALLVLRGFRDIYHQGKTG